MLYFFNKLSEENVPGLQFSLFSTSPRPLVIIFCDVNRQEWLSSRLKMS